MLAKFLAFKQGQELFGFVEGDDGLFATDALLNEGMYKALGFTIKIVEVRDPCAASFCGMIFAESGEIIRDPIAFMAGFGWTSSFISAGPKIMHELLRAKALSAVYETPQCPIVGVLARIALARTRGYAARFVEDGYHVFPHDEIPLPAFSPSMDTRLLVAQEFGIAPEVQILIERRLLEGSMDVVGLLDPERVRPYLEYTSKYIEVG